LRAAQEPLVRLFGVIPADLNGFTGKNAALLVSCCPMQWYTVALAGSAREAAFNAARPA